MNIILYDFEIQNLLKNGKGQIRRVCKVQPPYLDCKIEKLIDTTSRDHKKNIGKYRWDGTDEYFTCPFGAVGEKIWAKETWCMVTRLNDCYGKRSNLCGGIDSWNYYKADGRKLPDGFTWRSPVTMPREASRITIVPDKIWTERVQDINGNNLWAEGFGTASEVRTPYIYGKAKAEFEFIWDSHAKPGYKFADNLMVFAAEVMVK
jgi:hypothetical protein